jgi:hypothetical protein
VNTACNVIDVSRQANSTGSGANLGHAMQPKSLHVRADWICASENPSLSNSQVLASATYQKRRRTWILSKRSGHDRPELLFNSPLFESVYDPLPDTHPCSSDGIEYGGLLVDLYIDVFVITQGYR